MRRRAAPGRRRGPMSSEVSGSVQAAVVDLDQQVVLAAGVIPASSSSPE